MTLTDLQEAEKTIGRSRTTKTREEEKEEKEKQDKEKQEERKETETKDDDYRYKYRTYDEVHILNVYIVIMYYSNDTIFYNNNLNITASLTSSSYPPLSQRSRPSSSSTSTISSVSTASTPSYSSTTSSSSSSLNRPNSLTGITSSYSRSSRDTEKGECFSYPIQVLRSFLSCGCVWWGKVFKFKLNAHESMAVCVWQHYRCLQILNSHCTLSDLNCSVVNWANGCLLMLPQGDC